MAKQVFIHTRLSRAYLALARLSCMVIVKNKGLLNVKNSHVLHRRANIREYTAANISETVQDNSESRSQQIGNRMCMDYIE